MKKIVSIFTIVFTLLSCICFSYGEVKDSVEELEVNEVRDTLERLEGFDEALEDYNPAYLDLNNKGMIKVWNKEVKASDKVNVEINGMIADKYKAVVFYTVKSKKIKLSNPRALKFTGKTLLPYGNSGYQGGFDSYKGKNEVKVIQSTYGKLNPIDDSVSFSINLGGKGTDPIIVSLPFTEDNFVSAYAEKDLDINIPKEHTDYKISKLYASPMQTLLFMEEHQKVKGFHKERVNLKGSSLSYDNDKLKNFGGGGTRIDDDTFLSYCMFSPLDEAPDVLIWEYEDKKFEIDLKDSIPSSEEVEDDDDSRDEKSK